MPYYDFDIGVLGGGAAGLTVAAGAGRFGAKTLLIEKEKALGGDCLHYGCVPSKTLIRTAKIYHMMRQAAKFGLPDVELRPVDYRDVAQRIRSVISKIQEKDSVERFCKLGVRVEFGNAEFTDEHSVRLNGKLYSARSWVIATGSSPAVPLIAGIGSVGFLTNREIFSLGNLPESMTVIGGGPIAIEMAQAFNRLGTKVSVIQRSGQILSREDKDMADMLMDMLKSEGITFYLNAPVTEMREAGTEKEVVFKNSDGVGVSLKSEKLLIALGRQPNVGGLGLESLSVSLNKKGLEVDKRLRTCHKHIFAAGDVTGEYQFTHAAGYEGGIVLSNAILRLPMKTDYTCFPWCTYTDPELASIGMNEKRAKEAGIEYTVWTEEFRANDRSIAEAEETGKIKLLIDNKGKPAGIQILGPGAGELLSEWIAVMNGNVKLSKIAGAVHPYPSLSEINKRVVGNFFSEKLFSERIKKTLKFFFNLKGRACEK